MRKKVIDMSLDAIKQVTLAEAETKQRKADALAAAKKLVAEAEQSGKEALRAAKAAAEANAKELMAQAEQRAVGRAEEAAKQSQQACADLRSTAEGRLDQAAELIVRRVVSS